SERAPPGKLALGKPRERRPPRAHAPVTARSQRPIYGPAAGSHRGPSHPTEAERLLGLGPETYEAEEQPTLALDRDRTDVMPGPRTRRPSHVQATTQRPGKLRASSATVDSAPRDGAGRIGPQLPGRAGQLMSDVSAVPSTPKAARRWLAYTFWIAA